MSLWNELEEMFETSRNSIKVYNANVKTSGSYWKKIGVTTNSSTWIGNHLHLPDKPMQMPWQESVFL